MIKCNLDNEIKNNYILYPYLYYDDKEIITIFQNDMNNYLFFECNQNKDNDSGKINIVAVGFFCGLIGLLALIVGASFYNQGCPKKDKIPAIPHNNNSINYNKNDKSNIYILS